MPKIILFDQKNTIILNKDNEFIDLNEGNKILDKLVSAHEQFYDLRDYFQQIKLELDNKFVTPELAINIKLLNGGLLVETDYYACVIPDEILVKINQKNSSDDYNSLLQKYFATYPVRKYLLQLNPVEQDKLALITKARQIAFWNFNHKYCGRCASHTKTIKHEYARQCISCNYAVYPRISPCVLAAVVNKDKILLGRAPHFPPGVYSLFAGFVEAGESCEQAVEREVFEEVGVKISNIKYFGSQPWPFPHSMMLAYKADYISGDVVIDKTELEDARWFTFESLRSCPDLLPSKVSLSRMLLDTLIASSAASVSG